MNQNNRHFLNMNSEEKINHNPKAQRSSVERYPGNQPKPNMSYQKTINMNNANKNIPPTDHTQTKNMKLILKKTNYYPDSNPLPRNSSKTNKIEISNNIKIAKDDPSSYNREKDSSRNYNNNSTNLSPNPHIAKFYNNYKENENMKNDIIYSLKGSNVPNTPNPNLTNNCFINNNYVPSVINNYHNNKVYLNKTIINSNNKVEASTPVFNEGLNLLKKKNIQTINNNNTSQKFYSPPNYNKKKDTLDNLSEENYEINDSNKPNAININVTQNKLILTKRDSENEIFNKHQVYSQQNSPYLLTDNTKKSKENPKTNEFKNDFSTTNDSQNNSKTAIQSFKDFSENFMKKTKNLFTFESKKNARNKCKCDPLLNENNQTCSRAMHWIQYSYKLGDLENLKRDYENMQLAQPDEKCVIQIEKDLPRTFPSYSYFDKDSEGIQCLKRILVTFSKYDANLGYVQGMNFIAGNLLFHAEEYLAFWLLVMLFEIFELRDIFLPKLPGLSKHGQILEILIFKNMPDFYGKMAENMITLNMFFSPWIFSLFGVLIPIESMGDFLDNLLKGKWPFVYKFVLVYLQILKPKLIEEDTVGMLTFLTENNYKTGNQQEAKLNWKNCLKEANKISLENGFINKMLDNFNPDKQQFYIK